MYRRDQILQIKQFYSNRSRETVGYGSMTTADTRLYLVL